jgi:hypothetical protein
MKLKENKPGTGFNSWKIIRIDSIISIRGDQRNLGRGLTLEAPFGLSRLVQSPVVIRNGGVSGFRDYWGCNGATRAETKELVCWSL